MPQHCDVPERMGKILVDPKIEMTGQQSDLIPFFFGRTYKVFKVPNTVFIVLYLEPFIFVVLVLDDPIEARASILGQV